MHCALVNRQITKSEWSAQRFYLEKTSGTPWAAKSSLNADFVPSNRARMSARYQLVKALEGIG